MGQFPQCFQKQLILMTYGFHTSGLLNCERVNLLLNHIHNGLQFVCDWVALNH